MSRSPRDCGVVAKRKIVRDKGVVEERSDVRRGGDPPLRKAFFGGFDRLFRSPMRKEEGWRGKGDVKDAFGLQA